MDKGRILIVEDDPNVSELVGLYLQREGFAVEYVDDGQKALDAIDKTPFDLVVLDLMLPSVDGLEVCRRVRRKSDLPIVMLTTTGARTGELRTLPVLALPVDDDLILIASNYGRPSNPGWYYNLRAQPYVTIIWRGSSVPMHARELTGDERQR